MIGAMRLVATQALHVLRCASERPTVAIVSLAAGMVLLLSAGWTVALNDWRRWRYDPPTEMVAVRRAETVGTARAGGTLTYVIEADRLEEDCISVIVQPRLVAVAGDEVWHLPSYLGRSPADGQLRTTVAVPERAAPGAYNVEVDVLYQCAWGQMVRVARVAVMPVTIAPGGGG